MTTRRLTNYLAVTAALAMVPLSCSGCADTTLPAAPMPAANDSTPSDQPASDGSQVAESTTGPVTNATLGITFDDIKFEMEKDGPFFRSMLTPDIEKLVDCSVKIRGYILPSFQQTGLTQFVLVRDNMSCCFGPGAALFDCIVVEMKPGKSTDFTIRPVAVEGTFSVNEILDPDGKHLAIYHLDGNAVE
jgi:hypothetical protein